MLSCKTLSCQECIMVICKLNAYIDFCFMTAMPNHTRSISNMRLLLQLCLWDLHIDKFLLWPCAHCIINIWVKFTIWENYDRHILKKTLSYLKEIFHMCKMLMNMKFHHNFINGVHPRFMNYNNLLIVHIHPSISIFGSGCSLCPILQGGQHWLCGTPGGRLKIKMSSYHYRDPCVKDKMVLWPSYL